MQLAGFSVSVNAKVPQSGTFATQPIPKPKKHVCSFYLNLVKPKEKFVKITFL